MKEVDQSRSGSEEDPESKARRGRPPKYTGDENPRYQRHYLDSKEPRASLDGYQVGFWLDRVSGIWCASIVTKNSFTALGHGKSCFEALDSLMISLAHLLEGESLRRRKAPGKTNLRLSPDLESRLRVLADSQELELTAFISKVLKERVSSSIL